MILGRRMGLQGHDVRQTRGERGCGVLASGVEVRGANGRTPRGSKGAVVVGKGMRGVGVNEMGMPRGWSEWGAEGKCVLMGHSRVARQLTFWRVGVVSPSIQGGDRGRHQRHVGCGTGGRDTSDAGGLRGGREFRTRRFRGSVLEPVQVLQRPREAITFTLRWADTIHRGLPAEAADLLALDSTRKRRLRRSGACGPFPLMFHEDFALKWRTGLLAAVR
jgi:hypothetical protein